MSTQTAVETAHAKWKAACDALAVASEDTLRKATLDAADAYEALAIERYYERSAITGPTSH